VVEMSDSANAQGGSEDWARSYLQAWSSHDPEAVFAFVNDEIIYDDLALGEHMEGKAELREFISGLGETLSTDYRFELGTFVVANDETYALEWTMSGTNDRANTERGLPATGQSFRIPGISIGRLRDGKITENHDYWNLAGYLMQVGLMPGSEEASPASS
jgi:steroid delta-isomerase-like uncharacterized protein